LKFDLVVAIFPNLIANDYKSHVVVNGLVTFWLISTSDGIATKSRVLQFHHQKVSRWRYQVVLEKVFSCGDC